MVGDPRGGEARHSRHQHRSACGEAWPMTRRPASPLMGVDPTAEATLAYLRGLCSPFTAALRLHLPRSDRLFSLSVVSPLSLDSRISARSRVAPRRSGVVSSRRTTVRRGSYFSYRHRALAAACRLEAARKSGAETVSCGPSRRVPACRVGVRSCGCAMCRDTRLRLATVVSRRVCGRRSHAWGMANCALAIAYGAWASGEQLPAR